MSGVLVVLVGAAGAGKSTWAAARYQPTEIWCLDALRADVSDDECDQDATADAVEVMNLVLGKRLARGLRCVVDATNTNPDDRKQLLALAAEYQAHSVAVVFPVSFDECKARNDARPGPQPGKRWGRAVPETELRKQFDGLAAVIARPQVLLAEGFDAVELAG